jgi:hypothetical protein
MLALFLTSCAKPNNYHFCDTQCVVLHHREELHYVLVALPAGCGPTDFSVNPENWHCHDATGPVTP